MKSLSKILILLVCINAVLSCKNKTTNTEETVKEEVVTTKQADDPTKGLTIATKEILSTKQITLDGETIAVYTEDGERVRGMKMMELVISGVYSPDFYMDKDQEIKVAVLRPKVKDEKTQE